NGERFLRNRLERIGRHALPVADKKRRGDRTAPGAASAGRRTWRASEGSRRGGRRRETLFRRAGDGFFADCPRPCYGGRILSAHLCGGAADRLGPNHLLRRVGQAARRRPASRVGTRRGSIPSEEGLTSLIDPRFSWRLPVPRHLRAKAAGWVLGPWK